MPTGSASAIYAHKIFAPRRLENAVFRGAIVEQALGPAGLRVVVLQGPAGHGKTTTLQQLKAACEARGITTSWLTFDEADNDAPRGFGHIQVSVSKLAGQADGTTRAEATPAGRHRRREGMPGMILDQALRLDRPSALFFDEFQTLQENALLHFFRALLDRLPEHVRVFIGTRAVPDIGLPRLVVNGRALILRSDELRFSAEEVTQFFAASASLAMQPEELQVIHARTEGWPAALQLYRLALASPQVRQTLGAVEDYRPRELAEYLVENVLNLQSPETQDFLLRTSLLNRVSPGLCDAVMQRADSRDMLAGLERSGLFLRALDSDQRWYKYHGLFSSFLADHISARSPDVALEVHIRAAQWTREAGMPEEAIHHALAAGDSNAAADVMNGWASTLSAGGHLITAERWFDRLPFAEVAARPDLAIKLAYSLIFLRRHAKLAPLLPLLRRYAGLGSIEATTDPSVALAMAAVCDDDMAEAYAIISGVKLAGRRAAGFAAFELGAGGNLAAYFELAMGAFEPAREYLSLSRAQCDRGDADFSLGYNWGLTGASLLMQGKLPDALDVFRAAMARQPMQIEGSLAAVAIAACNIWALYEANDLDQVENLFGRYHDGIANAVLLDFLAVAYLPMARTHDARGRHDQAVALLDEAEGIGHAHGWERLVRMVQWERVRRWLVAGALDPALTLAGRLPQPRGWADHGWLLFSEEVGGETISRIRAAIHGGDLDIAGRALTQLLAQQRDRVTLRIKLYLLECQMHLRRGARATAHRSLRRALELARPGRMIRSFIDEGDMVLRLLREAHQGGGEARPAADCLEAEREFVGRILQAASVRLEPPPATNSVKLETLTDRECEILRFLASGVSNRSMAGQIFVSENTVKFHLKNIYSKLAVENRLQAVTAARQLGLVD